MIPQHGGRRLSEGAYGCIFTPPLICRGEKGPRGGWKNGKLGKITDKDDIKGELVAAKVFSKKPEAKKYLILPEIPSLCVPAPIAEQKETHFNRCDILKKQSYDDMLHYEVEYGGITVHKSLDDISLIVNDFQFSTFMGDMLEIGAYITLSGFIHNDLHGNNILVNKKYHPRLIDFGRSYFANAINQETIDMLMGMTYAPNLSQVPPEISIQDGLDDGLSLKKIMQDIQREKPGLRDAERILGVSRDREILELSNFWKTSKSIQQGDWIRFFQLYWPVVDSWAIGSILIGAVRKLSISKQFTEGNDWKQHQGIIKTVLKGLLKASPRQRLDCVQALALYDPMNAVVLSASGKAWLQQKKS